MITVTSEQVDAAADRIRDYQWNVLFEDHDDEEESLRAALDIAELWGLRMVGGWTYKGQPAKAA